MHSQKITTLLRSALAAGCALAMCATLAGCSNNSSSSSSSSKESSKQTVNMDQIAGITATGKLGEKPKVTFKTPMTVQNNTYAVLQKGDGARSDPPGPCRPSVSSVNSSIDGRSS